MTKPVLVISKPVLAMKKPVCPHPTTGLCGHAILKCQVSKESKYWSKSDFSDVIKLLMTCVISA